MLNTLLTNRRSCALSARIYPSVVRAREIRQLSSEVGGADGLRRRADMEKPSCAQPSVFTRPARAALSRSVLELTAQRLRVIADPTRIALLEALNEGEAGVQELADQVGLLHQTASRNLASLHQAGFLERRREGTSTRYVVADYSAWWVIEQIARWVESCQQERGEAVPSE